MQTTVNLGLKKPEGIDVVNVQDFNDNADLLDNYAAMTATLIGTKAPLASPALTGMPSAPNAVVDTSTTQVATTAFVLGQAGTTAPAMNGTAGAGTSKRYARADHVHPVDTSRAAQVDFTAHLADNVKHITSTERTTWNASASETTKGNVELATAAETTTGTDNTRAVHPAGLKVELDKRIPLTQKGAVNGVASLGADGKVPSSQSSLPLAVPYYPADTNLGIEINYSFLRSKSYFIKSVTGTTPTLAWEGTIKKAGTYRVRFGIYTSNTGTCNGRIYKNGVPYGISRASTEDYDVTGEVFMEDLAFSVNDKIQIYIWESVSANQARLRSVSLTTQGDVIDSEI